MVGVHRISVLMLFDTFSLSRSTKRTRGVAVLALYLVVGQFHVDEGLCRLLARQTHRYNSMPLTQDVENHS
jgi:hypothetical protein